MTARRDFITVLLAGTALAGCSQVLPGPGSTPPIVPPVVTEGLGKVISYLSDISTAIQAFLPMLGSFVSSDTLSKIQGWVGTVQRIAAELSTAASGGVQDLVKLALSSITSILSALNVSLPGEIQMIITAIQALLPFIGGFIGLRMASRSTMSEDQAVAVLRKASARR